MHMMVGGAGVLVLAFLIALVVVGPVIWRSLPAILAAIVLGTAAGFAAAVAAESRERRRSRSRARSQPPPREEKPRSKQLECPFCGGAITPELAVCPTCFRDLKRNCPSCGAVVAVREARCPECGKALPPTVPASPSSGVN